MCNCNDFLCGCCCCFVIFLQIPIKTYYGEGPGNYNYNYNYNCHYYNRIRILFYKRRGFNCWCGSGCYHKEVIFCMQDDLALDKDFVFSACCIAWSREGFCVALFLMYLDIDNVSKGLGILVLLGRKQMIDKGSCGERYQVRCMISGSADIFFVDLESLVSNIALTPGLATQLRGRYQSRC